MYEPDIDIVRHIIHGINHTEGLRPQWTEGPAAQTQYILERLTS